ncbi:UNVERIFIED_CONTAM: hypothetical protein RMT77_007503 [Armadillidium vulgare]
MAFCNGMLQLRLMSIVKGFFIVKFLIKQNFQHCDTGRLASTHITSERSRRQDLNKVEAILDIVEPRLAHEEFTNLKFFKQEWSAHCTNKVYIHCTYN